MSKVEIEKNDKFETCVMCGKETDVLKVSHINNRTTYVEGAGQLCVECYTKVYG